MKKQKTHLRLQSTDSAALVSALLFYLGFGLHPLPILSWLILLPLLIVAPRVSAKRTVILSLTAGLLGQIGLAAYFATTLQMPPVLLVALIIYVAAVLASAVSLGRIFLLRHKPFLAVLAVAGMWVSGEYLLTILAPHGAWWSLGYTQSSVLPILQVVSVTGIWGLSFLITAFPTAVAAMTIPGATTRSRIKIGASVVLIAVLVTAFGIVQLDKPDTNSQMRVASAVVAESSDELAITTDAGEKVLDDYQIVIEHLAAQHVDAVVFSEKSLQADQDQLDLITDPLSRAAKQHNITVVVGVMVKTAPETYENHALIFTPGQGEASYVKRHLIPGLESDFNEGDALAFVPGSDDTQGVIICKDLDFQDFARSYRQAGASILFAPAWDFNNDGWLHSRIAITRGVENGMAIVRTGRDGQLTISDANGRVLAEETARANVASTAIASIPTKTSQTVYATFGDWLAYVSIVTTIGGIGYLVITRKR